MNSSETITQIQSLLRGWTGRSDELKILELLRNCPDADLDTVLKQLNVRRLLRNLHNRVGGPHYRSQLVQLLTEQRIAQLSLETRVELVWAMQRGSTRTTFEQGIRNIFVASTGDELRELRNEINLSDSYRDLARLIFKDIDNQAIRDEILNHIQSNSVKIDQVKVLSDIDDTVFARLHDKRYPGKTRYPGVLAFFAALNHSLGKESDDANITFVTARPGLFGGIVSAWTRRTLAKAGIRRPTILTGSLFALRSHDSMARRKIRNIRQYHEVFPEYGLVFVGDSGQGDVEVGKLMLQEFPDSVRSVMIHDINETSLNHPSHTEILGIRSFDTYIAAATLAWKEGLITRQQALEVSSVAMKELRNIKVMLPEQKKSRLRDYEQDLKALQADIIPGDT